MYINVLNKLKATVSLKAYKIHDFPFNFLVLMKYCAEQYIEHTVITQFIIASVSTNSYVIITQVKNRALPALQQEEYRFFMEERRKPGKGTNST